MEVTSELNLSLTLFFGFTAIIVFIAGIFLIKIFIRTSDLLESVNTLLKLVNYEFKPAMDELQKTLKHLSSISDKADKHVCQFSETIDTASVTTNAAVKKAKIGMTSIIYGITEAFRTLFYEK